TDLRRADLTRADLDEVSLIDANLENAILTAFRIYGILVWNGKLSGEKQKKLVITLNGEPPIKIHNFENWQFIERIMYNKKTRAVIDTITSKVVLILGRFTEQREAVLDAIREELRKRNSLPVLFDFDKPASRDLTETVSTLAHMARFIIADITDPQSIP